MTQMTPRRRWDPFRELLEMTRMPWPTGEQRDGEWIPAVDVTERDGMVHITAELPGMKKDDVKVTVEPGAFVIEGERKSEHEKKEDNCYVRERTYGSFYRRIPLPKPVNADKAEGHYDDGVLTVTAPLVEPEGSKGVSVKIQ